MLVTPPAIIKPIAAPGAIPNSTNPPTVGMAANPLRYAGIPSNTELGIAHHAVPPRYRPISSAGMYVTIKLSSMNAKVSQRKRNQPADQASLIKNSRRSASFQNCQVIDVCSKDLLAPQGPEPQPTDFINNGSCNNL